MIAARDPVGVTPRDRLLTALPSVGSTLHGRDRELAELLASIDEHAVVTLVGGGGIGKTRLAVEAVRHLSGGRYRVGFVELADARTSRDVTSAIAGQLAVETTAGSSDREAIVHVVDVDDTVLVLDNFEHLVDVAADVIELLSTCTSLRLVVTSRCALGADDECVIEVPALDAVPSDDAIGAGVRLFLERAQVASPGDDDLDVARRIVDSLGGLPLAIELAAARARTLGPTNVLDLLVRDLALDGLSQPDGIERHRSVRRCIQWSVSGLEESARRVFRVTGAFAGTFDLRALRAVAGAEPSTAVGIAALLDHHLVARVERGPSGSARFTSAPPVRELALEQLRGSAECEAVLDAHAAWYESRAASLWTASNREPIEAVVGPFRSEEANLRRAIRHRVEHGRYADAARTLAELSKAAIERGREHEVNMGFLDLADAAAADGAELPCEARIWVTYVHLANRRAPRPSSALDRLEADLALARAAEDPLAVLVGLDRVVCSVFFHGDIARAVAAASEGVVLTEHLQLPRKLGEFSLWLGMLEHVTGDIAAAVRHGTAALEIARDLGDRRLLIRTVLLFAPLELGGHLSGREVGSIPTLDACRVTAIGLHSVIDEMYVVMQLALRDGLRGALEVYDHVVDGLELADRTRSHVAEVVCVLALAAAALRHGDDVVAAQLHAALGPQWPTLSVSVPSGTLDSYRRSVEHRRAPDPERFDAAVRAAGSQHWIETVAAARAHAERCRRRTRVGTSALTPRELDVLRELTDGSTNKEIAARLGMRPKTVMHHCAAIFRKLEVSTRAEAASVALRTGLVDLARPHRDPVI